MTGQRARLARLEARRREAADVEQIGIYEADLEAGVWRELNGGRTFPLSPEDQEGAEGAKATGGGLLILSPLPGRSKVISGLHWGDL